MNRRVFRVAPALLTGALLLAPGLAAHAGPKVDGFRTKIEKWVQTRQLISLERASWQVEQETLRATRDMLRDQKKALEAEIAETLASASESDEERRTLLLERGDYKRQATALAEAIRAMEADVLRLAPQLPAPLKKKLDPLLVQIPKSDETAADESRLGQRLVTVLGVLAQAEKFNDTATLVGETRELADGQKVAVHTLYWGLGQAIYADKQGERAGIGRPGAEGWVFDDRPELAGDVRRLLDIYQGNIDDLDFVALPVAVQ